jgi:hypothetical protein
MASPVGAWSEKIEDGPFGFLRSGSRIAQADYLVSLNCGLITIVVVVRCLMAIGTFLFTWSIIVQPEPTASIVANSIYSLCTI